MQESATPKFKVWQNRYDFSEINRTNYPEVFREYFKMTTKKVTLLAMLFVINILFNVISRFLLSLAPGIGGFLTFNITIWTIFITFMAFNFFYTFFFLEITVWFRLFYDPNIPGIVSINLNDLTFLIFFALFALLFNLLRFTFQKDYSDVKKRWGYFWTLIVAMVVAMLFTAALDTLYNWGFMIQFYNLFYQLNFDPNELWLLLTIFWFNIVQAIINIAIFSIFYKVSYTLINLYFV